MSAWSRSDYRDALDHFARALEFAETTFAVASIHNAVGITHLEQGQLREASDSLAESLRLRREMGDERGAQAASMNLGIAYGARGDLRKAVEHFQESEEVTRRLGLVNARGVVLDNLSIAHFELGELDHALATSNEAVRLQESQGQRRALANALASLARIHAERGEIAEGLAVARRAMAVALESEHVKAEVDGLVALAVLEPAQAAAHAGDAVELGRKIGYEPGVITASILLARATGDLRMIDDVLVTIRETDNLMDHSRALLARAHITGSAETAREALAAAEQRGQAKVAADARELLVTLSG